MKNVVYGLGLALPSCVAIVVLSVLWRYYDAEEALIYEQIGMVYILSVNDAEHLGGEDLSEYFKYFEREEVVVEPVAYWELQYKPWTPIGQGPKRVHCIRGEKRFEESWYVLTRSEPSGFHQEEKPDLVTADHLLGD